MKQKLASITDIIAGGIQPALEHSATPLWTDGRNVVFQEQSIRPIPAQIGVAGKLSTAPPRGAIEVRLAGVRTIFWGTQTKLFKLTEGSGTPIDVTRASGAYTGVKDSTASVEAHIWSFAQWGDNAVAATNGKDKMQYFEAGDAKFTDFDDAGNLNAVGAPTYANVLIQLNAMMLAIGTSNGATTIDWCSQDDLALWTPAPDNTAGSLTLQGMNSPIIAGEYFQNGIAVLGSDELFLLSWIGSPYYIGQNKLLNGIGAIGKQAVVPVGAVLYGICQRGIFRTDGVTVDWIDQPGIHDYLFSRSPDASDRINTLQAAKTFTWHDPSQNMVYFFYPGESSMEPDRGVGYNYANGSWTLLSYGRTTGTSGTVFFNPFLLDAKGGIYQQVIGDLAPSLGASPMTMEAGAVLTVGYDYQAYDNGGWDGVTNVAG